MVRLTLYFFLFTLSCSCVIGYPSKGTQRRTNNLVNLLEKVRDHMYSPIPALGIPRLEPLDFPYFALNVNNSFADVQGSISKVQIKGLSGFKVYAANVNPLILNYEFNVTFPTLEIVGDYVAKGSLGKFFSIDGAGPFKVQISNFDVYAKGGLRVKNKIITMGSMALGLKVSDISIHLGNITDKEDVNEFINSVVNNAALPAFQIYRSVLESEAVKYFTKVFDEKMANVSLNDVLDVVKGNKEIFPPQL